jgi:thiol-disulfide isomerase/thioredoxin
MKIIFIFFAACSLLLSASCNQSNKMSENKLEKGIWRASLKISADKELPFNFSVDDNGQIVIINAAERVKITDILYTNESTIVINFPVFSSYIEAVHKNGKLQGYWINPEKKDYKIEFSAEHNRKERFTTPKTADALNVSGKWEVSFSQGTDNAYKAIGIFEQNGSYLSGTFLTETGDYRFLEGQVDANKLMLSCFEGAHAFLFEADIENDKIINGTFYSGNHWQEPWTALRNENFSLANADSLTYLKEGFDSFNFSFPDQNGDTISLSDKKFQNKVLIVQIMGSWCPNCMDESVYLSELYNKYKSKGLEIIAIDYEIRNDFEVFKKNISKMKKDLGIEYTIVFGGLAKKAEAAKTLPMLNHILSYPTTIFMDKNKKIIKIETGFSGPGTGSRYEEYVKNTSKFIEELLNKE